MFGFFVNDEPSGIWGNEVGDIFFDMTCAARQWAPSQVDLNYYSGIVDHDHFDFNEKKLRLYKVDRDEDGKQVKILIKEIEPDSFVVKGLMIKPC